MMSNNQSVDDIPSTSAAAVMCRDATMIQQWNIVQMNKYLGSHELCVSFAEVYGLLPKSRLCAVHKTQMALRKRHPVGYFKCSRGNCKTKSLISRAAGTWFEGVKLSIPHVFYLMYCFAHRFTREGIYREDYVSVGKKLSSGTISDWYSYCREAVVIFQLDHQEVKGKIGGPGKVVQIDESKFEKRKYNKGRRVEGHWVLGMIEDGSEDLRLEVCPDNVRSAEVLIPLIRKHVHEGTTIRTDFWRAYECLPEYGYIHEKVNHSDPGNPLIAEDGTRSQRIESHWRVVKRFFYKDNYNNPANFADLIVEFLWRREIRKKKTDPFISLLGVIKYVYNTK
ncbi:uncharacterized protein LOC125775847 isoform X2 [Bactrocera dorsalis]|uniref:Uncharacterized protein LOC125775847 isoform X2 n=1 Tax=Bactrocera dorsalis TaxID=27457 RepID=A0ABM3J0S8_BACDO|nr:uncharacterized protein LOC125775847 isoform X2 [Bactrocera dorsalis]